MFKKILAYYTLISGTNPANIQPLFKSSTETKLHSGANRLRYWGNRALRILLFSLLLHAALCLGIAAISQSVLLGVVLFLLLPALMVFFIGSLLSRFFFQMVLLDVSAKTLFPNTAQGNSQKRS